MNSFVFLIAHNLEGPFYTSAGGYIEAFVLEEVSAAAPATGEVVGQFYFATNHQMVAAKVLTDVVPNLGFGEDDEFGYVIGGCAPVEVLTPDIEEAAESKTFHAKEVLHAPDEGELDGDVADFVIGTEFGGDVVELLLAADAFVHEFEGEGVGVALIVEEILNTEEPCVGGELAAVPLYMEAEGCEGGVLPDVDGTGNLGVVASGDNLVGGVVDVVEEESATVVVGLEHLKGSGEVATVEVVHFLNVGLSFGSDECQHQSCNEYYFFHIGTFLVDNN